MIYKEYICSFIIINKYAIIEKATVKHIIIRKQHIEISVDIFLCVHLYKDIDIEVIYSLQILFT